MTSNTSAESFLKFCNAFNAFEFNQSREPFMIERLEPNKTCPLMIATQPLRWITETLKNKVTSIQNTATALRYTSDGWFVRLSNDQYITGQKVIFALGAEPATLPYANLITIPLKIAVSAQLLKQAVTPEDTIAVFGSYQSARTVEENLAKTDAKKIIHFYRSERSFENNVASLNLSDRVECYPATATNLLTHTPRCNKAIYAVGFTRRTIAIDGLPEDFSYDTETGIIAPQLYGLGIAFPEILPHTNGRLAYKVSAIWPFVKYLKKIFPIWLRDPPLLDRLTQS